MVAYKVLEEKQFLAMIRPKPWDWKRLKVEVSEAEESRDLRRGYQ